MEDQADRRLFNTSQWIAYLGGLVAAAAALTAWAFQTFETKENHEARRAEIMHRLDSINDKMDRILELQIHNRAEIKKAHIRGRKGG